LADGCASFDAAIDWFATMSPWMVYYIKVNFTAQVLEQGTGINNSYQHFINNVEISHLPSV